jgi:tRNA A58 N-methylase Trm61
VLTVVVESLTQHASLLELIEAEMADKVAVGEFKQAMGQKLSLREFLGYFQKVEKVVEKMEGHWAAGESRTQEMMQRQLESFSGELQETLEQKLQQFWTQTVSTQQ